MVIKRKNLLYSFLILVFVAYLSNIIRMKLVLKKDVYSVLEEAVCSQDLVFKYGEPIKIFCGENYNNILTDKYLYVYNLHIIPFCNNCTTPVQIFVIIDKNTNKIIDTYIEEL